MEILIYTHTDLWSHPPICSGLCSHYTRTIAHSGYTKISNLNNLKSFLKYIHNWISSYNS